MSPTNLSLRSHRQLVADALKSLECHARKPGVLLKDHSTAADWFRLKLSGYEHEVFAAAWLDIQLRLIDFEELFRGTIDANAVPPREVVKSALRHNASAVLFAHNHPSGSAIASDADIALTIELTRALSLVDVRVLDHFVVSAIQQPSSVWRGTAKRRQQTRSHRASCCQTKTKALSQTHAAAATGTRNRAPSKS